MSIQTGRNFTNHSNNLEFFGWKMIELSRRKWREVCWERPNGSLSPPCCGPNLGNPKDLTADRAAYLVAIVKMVNLGGDGRKNER
jgi:hypothetical protein